jgi:hypothetical protein
MAAASAHEARVCRFLLIVPAYPPATTAELDAAARMLLSATHIMSLRIVVLMIAPACRLEITLADPSCIH